MGRTVLKVLNVDLLCLLKWWGLFEPVALWIVGKREPRLRIATFHAERKSTARWWLCGRRPDWYCSQRRGLESIREAGGQSYDVFHQQR